MFESIGFVEIPSAGLVDVITRLPLALTDALTPVIPFRAVTNAPTVGVVDKSISAKDCTNPVWSITATRNLPVAPASDVAAVTVVVPVMVTNAGYVAPWFSTLFTAPIIVLEN